MSYNAQESRSRVSGPSSTLENAINRIVDEHISNLSAVIDKIKNMLNDDTDILTDQEIEDILLQLHKSPITNYQLPIRGIRLPS